MRVSGPVNWLRGLDLNQRPSGYEPDELPGCSTPHQVPDNIGPEAGVVKGAGVVPGLQVVAGPRAARLCCRALTGSPIPWGSPCRRSVAPSPSEVPLFRPRSATLAGLAMGAMLLLPSIALAA